MFSIRRDESEAGTIELTKKSQSETVPKLGSLSLHLERRSLIQLPMNLMTLGTCIVLAFVSCVVVVCRTALASDV